MEITDLINTLTEESQRYADFIATGKGHYDLIVGRDGSFVKTVDLDEMGRTTGKFSTTHDPLKAMKFDRYAATTLAKITHNGNGAFSVYTKLAACKECKHRADSILESLK